MRRRSGIVRPGCFVRDLARFRMKIFAAPKKIENFRCETRSKTRPNQRATSFRCSADLVRTCWSAAEVARRPAGLILARSRTISDDNFCGTDSKFENFRSETRWKMQQNWQAASRQCQGDLVRTCRSAAEVGRRPLGLISARSHTISPIILNENSCGTEKKSKNFGPKCV